MAYTYPTYSFNGDGLFGPTKNGNKYKSVYYHNKTAARKKGKNKWRIKQNEQYHTFKVADESIWFSKKHQCFFSVLDGGFEIFGVMEERLAYFEKPANTTSPWHGYPIFSSEFDIDEDLLDKWEKEEIVSSKIRKKLGNGQW